MIADARSMVVALWQKYEYYYYYNIEVCLMKKFIPRTESVHEECYMK